MSQELNSIALTDRDIRLLRILARGPHTPQQLLRLTQFPNLDKLWRRLRILQSAKLVANWSYAPIVDRSSYFKLTRHAYRLLFIDELLPSDAYFNEIKLGSQKHSFAVAEFATLIEQDAFSAGWQFVNYRRDRELEIVVGGKSIFPDAYMRLQKGSQALDVLLEIDCGTEPIRSSRNRESLQKKILLYDTLARQSNVWFRVFHVFTTSRLRMNHFHDLVSDLIEQPKTRTPFVAAMLDDIRAANNPATDLIYLDHRRQSHAVILPFPGGPRTPKQKNLPAAASVC